MNKFGFFGGTFDPIHFGHLNLAINILEKHNLDQIFFSPANYSPEKENSLPSVSKKHRKEMVQIAIEEIPEFSLLAFELEKEGPSYTIDTVKHLKKEYKEAQFYLILGEDTLRGLANWKEIEKLLQLAPPLVGTRPSGSKVQLPPSIQKAVEKGKTPITSMEISSTDLRMRLSQKKYCGHLVPSKILDYIKENNLYSSDYARRTQ